MSTALTLPVSAQATGADDPVEVYSDQVSGTIKIAVAREKGRCVVIFAKGGEGFAFYSSPAENHMELISNDPLMSGTEGTMRLGMFGGSSAVKPQDYSFSLVEKNGGKHVYRSEKFSGSTLMFNAMRNTAIIWLDTAEPSRNLELSYVQSTMPATSSAWTKCLSDLRK